MKKIMILLLFPLLFIGCTTKLVRVERIYPSVADTYISKDFDQKKIYKVGILPVFSEGVPDDTKSIYSAKLLQQVLYAVPNFKVIDVNILQNELSGINKADYLKKSTLTKLSKSLGLDLILYSVYKYRYNPEQSTEDSKAAYSGAATNAFGVVGGQANKNVSSKGSEYILIGGVFSFYDVKDMSVVMEIATKSKSFGGSLSDIFKEQLLTEIDLLEKGNRTIRRDKNDITVIEDVGK